MNTTSARLAVLATGDAVVLATYRPQWATVATGLTQPRAWLAAGPDRALAAACGVLLWLAAAWIAIGLVVALGARLPGCSGRVASHCVRIVVPRVLLRVVLGSTGLGLLAVPAAQAATPATSIPAASTSTASSAPAVIRTVSAPAASTWVHASSWLSDRDAEKSVPAPTWPVGAGAATPLSVPAPIPPTSTAPTSTPPASTAPAARVHPGDSLWLLAARRLGPHAREHDIAQYWPQVYAANRNVIGDDPSVIHPGQVLDLPAPTTQESR